MWFLLGVQYCKFDSANYVSLVLLALITNQLQTGSLEGQWALKTHKLVSLSEQNLVDCCTPFGNDGCNGGWMNNAFNYIFSSGGIDTESSYPYETRDAPCRFKRNSVGATIRGIVNIPPRDEVALTRAVSCVGPISVALLVTDNFQFYSSGVFDDKLCKANLTNDDLNHAVTVVGYGSEKGYDYYIVKNSWGLTWGDHGYIKMSRNRNNQCGIANAASYPIV